MRYQDVKAQLEQNQKNQEQTAQFLKMNLALEKQIRDLEFKIGKMKFEKKNTDKEQKKLEKLKQDRTVIDPVKQTKTITSEVLRQSQLPNLKIKSIKGLEEVYANLAGYAMKFPKTKKPNIVLSGDTGTGKTFALVYLGTELIENKVFPLYTTAFGLVDRYKRFVFERDEHAFRELLDAEVLLIDDLGTEPRIPNITDENFYNLINERLLGKRPFVISTNLTPDELINRYGERIAGRILARETASVIRFDGKDLRLG